MKINNDVKFLNNNLKKIYYEYKNIISLNIVGSANVKKKFSEISDIDVVVILKKIDKKIFQDFIRSIKKVKLRKHKDKVFKLKINHAFGPLKFKNDNTIVIHMMLYDIKSH